MTNLTREAMMEKLTVLESDPFTALQYVLKKHPQKKLRKSWQTLNLFLAMI